MTETVKPQNAKKGRPGRPRSKPKTQFGRWFESHHSVGQISAEVIEEALRCSRTYVNELIQGKKVPSLPNACKLIDLSRTKHLTTIRPEWFLPDDPPQTTSSE